MKLSAAITVSNSNPCNLFFQTSSVTKLVLCTERIQLISYRLISLFKLWNIATSNIGKTLRKRCSLPSEIKLKLWTIWIGRRCRSFTDPYKGWSKFTRLYFHSVVFNLPTLLISTGLWPVYRRLNFIRVPKRKESVDEAKYQFWNSNPSGMR